MNLILPFDHRFFRARNGTIFSDKSYNYSFFKNRYLKVFDHISILSRVADVNSDEHPSEGTEGRGVSVIALSDWIGPVGYFRQRKRILEIALREAAKPSAVIMIGPGGIGALAYESLHAQGYPIALEVVSDPWEAFQPGAVGHLLRPILRRWLTNKLRRECLQACAVSYVTNELLQRRYPTAGFSVGVSDVVLSEDSFVCRSRVFSNATPKTIISVAVMTNGYKGHHVMVDAIRICKAMDVPLSLVMVGDGPLRCEIERRAEKEGVLDRIRFAGQLPAGAMIRAELDRADLFILPSLTEGMPRALLEAMARALPAVASRVGGVPEVIDSEFMVPPGNAEALATKLKCVLSDPAKMSEMSACNFRRARDFEDSKLSSKRQAFYRQVQAMTEQHSSLQQSPLLISHSDFACSP